MPYKLIVFDLDFTLWNAGGTWCDHTYPPYRKSIDSVLDSMNNKIFLYPGVIGILSDLHEKGFEMGLASRTYEPSWAKRLLELFEIDHYFTYKEIYPGSKKEHFRQISSKSGIEFTKMIFFDDELRNIEDAELLGVKSILVTNGISNTIIDKHIFNGKFSGLTS